MIRAPERRSQPASAPHVDTAHVLRMAGVTHTFHVDHGPNRARVIKTVLADLDFSLPCGRIVGLIGPTGVGKTTLGRILTGLLTPDAGQVLLDDQDIFTRSEGEFRLLRRCVRFVPQNPDAVALPGTPVGKILDEAAQLSRLEAAQARQWAERLHAFGLLEREWPDKPVEHLSVGERRRVLNIRGLPACPSFAVFDEPFNGLDVESKAKTLALFRHAAGEGMGILLISHDVDTLRGIGETVLRLENGRLVREPAGTTQTVQSLHRHDISEC